MRRTLKQRRRLGKTNYLKRIKLLKSRMPRVVFRRTNKYIIAQYVTSKEAKDRVLVGISSRVLLSQGWPKEREKSLKSIPAAYLTGLVLGKEIVEKKLTTPVCDIGMVRSIKGNRFFAFLKGLKDAGVKIKCDDESFPSEDRINGKHLKGDSSKIVKGVKSKVGGK